MDFRRITPAKLGQGAIGTSNTTLYTAGANERPIVKEVFINNTTSNTLNVDYYMVPSGDSAGTANSMLVSHPVPGNDFIQITGTQVMDAGDALVFKGSAAGLTVRISGGIGE